LGQIRALYSNQQSQKSHTQFFIHISSGEKKITFDRKVVKELKATFVSTDTLQGVTGQSVGIRGVYRGRVKKLVLDYKDFSGDLQRSGLFDGDFILVANHTTPELLPMMKRSLAVVTDVGGILSHAAITCRELKKPCIIGTKIATQVLKDGDIVEVDAEEGVVRVISR
jgi:phosphoenolpyruvate synthase/pyruvate phosphate dikinase